jgi:hypothetical protein
MSRKRSGDRAHVKADVLVADDVDRSACRKLGADELARGGALRRVGEPHLHRPNDVLAQPRGLLLDLLAGAQRRGEFARLARERLKPDADTAVGDRVVVLARLTLAVLVSARGQKRLGSSRSRSC